jgi:hypothetical protein
VDVEDALDEQHLRVVVARGAREDVREAVGNRAGAWCAA